MKWCTLDEWPLTYSEDVVGFFLQIVIVSLCSLIILMRMARDRKRALKSLRRAKRPAQEEEVLFQDNEILEEDETTRKLYRDSDDDDAHV